MANRFATFGSNFIYMFFRNLILSLTAIVFFAATITAQNIKGTIASSYSSAVFEKADFSQPNYGFVKNGAKFELLNTDVSTNPKYPSLFVVLVKITSDVEGGKHVGKTGWLNVIDIDLKKHFNETTRKIDLNYTASVATTNTAVSTEAGKMSEYATGIFGAIDNDLGYNDEFFERKDFSDTHGMLKNGASFEVMNTKILMHPKYSTYQVLVKVKFDPDGVFTGTTGWVDIQSTTLRKNFSQTSMKVSKEAVSDNNTASSTSTEKKSYPEFSNYSESKTGVTGAIANDSGSEVFDRKDFSTPTFGFVKNGATFDLLNTAVAKHPIYGLNMILIKITFDPENKNTGSVGWVNVDATSLQNSFNATSMTISKATSSAPSTTSKPSSYPEYGNYNELKTGITGAVANDNYNDDVFYKKDFSTPSHGFIKNGATFDLLNKTVISNPNYPSLYMVLIKVTYDPESKHTGKVGWVQAKATSLKPRFNKTTMKIE
jgi:hypothetical protein